MKKIFVIVVLYNAEKWIDTCFSSLSGSELPVEIVAIDNASTDQTVSLLRAKYPQVRLHQSGQNLGFGKANNLGMQYALAQGADYVFLLNQDATLEPATLTSLVEIHKGHPEYGILSPLHFDGSGKELDNGFYEYLVRGESGRPLVSSILLGSEALESVYPYPFINAAGWLISRACLEATGGFDPLFFHYGEDVNYCQRIHFHGFKLGVCPAVHMIHDRVRTFPGINEDSRVTLNRNYVNFLTRAADINAPGIYFTRNFLLSSYKANLAAIGRFDVGALTLSAKLLLRGRQQLARIKASRSQNIQMGRHYLEDISLPEFN